MNKAIRERIEALESELSRLKNNGSVYRHSGRKWSLPLTVPVENSMFKVSYFNVLGYRPPLKGEYYLSGAKVTAYQAKNNLTDNFLVIELLED